MIPRALIRALPHIITPRLIYKQRVPRLFSISTLMQVLHFITKFFHRLRCSEGLYVPAATVSHSTTPRQQISIISLPYQSGILSSDMKLLLSLVRHTSKALSVGTTLRPCVARSHSSVDVTLNLPEEAHSRPLRTVKRMGISWNAEIYQPILRNLAVLRLIDGILHGISLRPDLLRRSLPISEYVATPPSEELARTTWRR